MRGVRLFAVMMVAAVVSGCAGYNWRSEVPAAMRTVAVPTMRNESRVTELGSVTTRQLLREFQREGTFAIAPVGETALEIQGVIKDSGHGELGYDRRSGMRVRIGELRVIAEVSVIDKAAGKVLVDNRRYEAVTVQNLGQDINTANRDASGRLAEDLARQIVDDVLNLKWETGKAEK